MPTMLPHLRQTHLRQTRAVAFILAAACLPAMAQAQEPVVGESFLCHEAQATDGDSLLCENGLKVRLAGIDAPEDEIEDEPESDQPYGKDATQALRRLAEGRTLNCRLRDRDRYQRFVASCTHAGQDLSAQMVAQGMAWNIKSRKPDYADEMRTARHNRLGLWAEQYIRPWFWRILKKRTPPAYAQKLVIGDTFLCDKARVIDGDDLICHDNIRIHISGTDAPEGKQPHSKESKQALRDLANGRTLRCRLYDRDKFQRFVAACSHDGQDLGTQMVAQGMAWNSEFYTPDYADTMHDARRKRLGLWVADMPCPPWLWHQLQHTESDHACRA